MPGGKILLVEDEFLIRMIAAEALVEAGYPVVEASVGEQAIKILESYVDLAVLVTDVQMPGTFDGISVARRARALRPAMPIVFATARANSFSAFAERTEKDKVVEKPYGLDLLVKVVRGCVG